MEIERILLKKSILTLDGKNYAVDVREWGKLRLSADDYTNFQSTITKCDNLMVPFLESNTYTRTIIYEEINGIQINVGVLITRPVNFRLEEVHDEFMLWVDRMGQDPCITQFNQEEPAN